jgi:hypothetical protein
MQLSASKHYLIPGWQSTFGTVLVGHYMSVDVHTMHNRDAGQQQTKNHDGEFGYNTKRQLNNLPPSRSKTRSST